MTASVEGIQSKASAEVAHPMADLRVSMTGYALRVGRDEDRRNVAVAPESVMKGEMALKRYQEWLDDADFIVEACQAYGAAGARVVSADFLLRITSFVEGGLEAEGAFESEHSRQARAMLTELRQLTRARAL